VNRRTVVLKLLTVQVRATELTEIETGKGPVERLALF
jgi:hypothetical protein